MPGYLGLVRAVPAVGFPDDPVGSVGTGGQQIAWLAKSGNTVLATTDNFSGSAAVYAFDVATPATPTLEGSGTTDWANSSPPSPAQMARSEGLVAAGAYAYVATNVGDDFVVIDIAALRNPANLVNFPAAIPDPLGLGNGAFDVALVGNTALLMSALDDAVITIDVSTPLSPAALGSVTDTDLQDGLGIDAAGSHAYVCASAGFSGPYGLTVVDFSTPATPTVVGRLEDAVNIPWPLLDPLYDADYVYARSNTDDSVVVIDVSTKSAPTLTGILQGAPLDGPRGLAKKGNNLFVPHTGSPFEVGIEVIDVSDPANPTSIDKIVPPPGSNPGRCIIDGDYLYVIDNAIPGFSIFDVS